MNEAQCNPVDIYEFEINDHENGLASQGLGALPTQKVRVLSHRVVPHQGRGWSHLVGSENSGDSRHLRMYVS